MATHNRIRGNRTEIVGLDSDTINLDRLRKNSERSDITDISELSVPPAVRRRPMVRSMTEVRPDPLLEGLFFTARSHSINEPEPTPVPEEDENKPSEVSCSCIFVRICNLYFVLTIFQVFSIS